MDKKENGTEVVKITEKGIPLIAGDIKEAILITPNGNKCHYAGCGSDDSFPLR